MDKSEQQSWNEFIIANSTPSSFLQSWQWGEFQEALGNRMRRFTIGDAIQAQVIIKSLPLGRTYLEIPKGPVLNTATGDWRLAIGELRDKLRDIGQQEKAVLARVNPPYPHLLPSPGEERAAEAGVPQKPAGLLGWKGRERLPEAFGFRKPELLLRQMEPARTILVDLNKSEEELLANMHEKSRYNIRLAERKGVKVRVATQDKQAFEKFLELLTETTKRDKIVTWPKERFWKFRKIFMPKEHNAPLPPLNLRGGERELPHAELLVGEYQNQILAAAIIMLFGDSGTYLYAASSAKERSANAPSLVLWEAIKLSKSRGMKWYDLWGVAPASEPHHHWAGITRFKSRYVKLGVTGQEFFGTGTHDLILDRFYYGLFRLGKNLTVGSGH